VRIEIIRRLKIFSGTFSHAKKYLQDFFAGKKHDIFLTPTIGSKNSLIFIYFVHRYLPEKKLT